MKHIVIAVIIALVVTLFAVDILNPNYGWFAKVNAGYVGIVERFGAVRDTPLQPGFHITSYFEHVRPINVRTRRFTYTIEAFSADIQQVVAVVSINNNVSEESAGVLYKRIGTNYQQTLIEPKLQENAKVVISKYTAESLIENRELLSREILQKMKDDIEEYGIKVTDVSIENIDFTDAFEAAVEAKQVATQEKQKAKTQEEQKTMEAQQLAERKRIQADIEAETKKIEADAEAYSISIKAEANAEANKKISESLTDELIEYTKAQNWNGELPKTFVGSDSAIPVIQTDTDNTIDLDSEDQ